VVASPGLDVSLGLDRPDRTYRPGEAITGQVVLRVEEELTCSEVRLALHWRTSGRGDVEQGEAAALYLVLDERLEVGERAVPFSLVAPDGPPTFHGRLLNVHWVLDAFVHTNRGAVERQKELVLVGARSALLHGRLRGKVRTRALADVPPSAASLGLALLVSAIAAVTLAVMGNGAAALSFFMGVIGCGLAIVGVGMLLRPLAALRLGRVTLEVPEEVAPGERLRVAMSFTPPRPVPLNGIRVTLRAEESATSATSGSGPETRTRKRSDFQETVWLSGPKTIEPRGFTGDVELRVPPDAPASFQTAKNSICWTLHVEVDIPSWPDWSVEVPIVVVPGGSAVVTTAQQSVAIQPRQRCPYCREAIAGADPTPVSSCGGCATVLHEACWDELGRCPTRGCERDRPRARARGGVGA
jgi:hypothetical protein